MITKHPFLLSALVAMAVLGARAQTPAAAPVTPVASPPSWSITATPAFASQYMFRGARLSGPSFEPAIEYDAGPLALGVWSNFPISHKVPGQSDPEFDVYGSYACEIVKDTLTLQPGFTAYLYPNADKNNGFYKETFEPNVALNYTVSGVKLTPKFYYDVVLQQATYEFTATYAVPLTNVGTELDFTGTAGTFKATDAIEHASPRYKNWGDYYLIGVALPFQVTRSGKLSVGFAYTKGSDNFYKQGGAPKFANGGAVGRGVVSVSYAHTF